MNLFNTEKPFFLKFYANIDAWNSEKNSQAPNKNLPTNSIIFPVFCNLPATFIEDHPFGICVYNTDDISAIQAQFNAATSKTVHYFLYVMGDACRQTDTLEAASLTERPLIIEKGAFLSPDDIKRMTAKLTHKNYALVECGSSFGYADRVLDPRSLYALKETSPHFGICLTDLLAPQDEFYAHRSEWLSNEKFLQAFNLAAQNFNPNFYVYKAVSSRSEISSRPSMSSRGLTAGSSSAPLDPAVKPRDDTAKSRDDTAKSWGDTYAGGWDGSITPSVKLNRNQLTVIAGPCMLESLEIGLEVGTFLKNLCLEVGFQYIFKSSFDKANRTSVGGARGPGLEQGLKWLEHIKQTLNVPILTDVHNAEQAHQVSNVADVLQIPAFLFRERNLLLACAQTGKVLQIKKGQWASAQDMLNVATFLAEKNFHKVILAERGSCFGYNNLVVDFRNLVDMAEHKNAIVFDATHSVQLPGAKNGKSSGLRHMVPALTRAAIAVGIDGLFMEVHPNPHQALSDADTQLSFETAKEILQSCKQVRTRACPQFEFVDTTTP